mgnify:CR=1 FL=1
MGIHLFLLFFSSILPVFSCFSLLFSRYSPVFLFYSPGILLFFSSILQVFSCFSLLFSRYSPVFLFYSPGILLFFSSILQVFSCFSLLFSRYSPVFLFYSPGILLFFSSILQVEYQQSALLRGKATEISHLVETSFMILLHTLFSRDIRRIAGEVRRKSKKRNDRRKEGMLPEFRPKWAIIRVTSWQFSCFGHNLVIDSLKRSFPSELFRAEMCRSALDTPPFIWPKFGFSQ